MSDAANEPRLRDVSIPLPELMPKVIIAAVVLLVAPLALYALVWGLPALFVPDPGNWLIWLVLLIVFTLLHEGTHALGWMLFAGVRFEQIRFGLDRATLNPYAHAREPMLALGYRIGTALPLITTGLAPYLYGLWTQDGLWATLGAMMISGAVGDLFVLWVIRDVPNMARVLDHPKNAGCYVVEE